MVVNTHLEAIYMHHPDLHAARELIAQASAITVLSGSGLSAASGLATFRGDRTSLWHRPGPIQPIRSTHRNAG